MVQIWPNKDRKDNRRALGDITYEQLMMYTTQLIQHGFMKIHKQLKLFSEGPRPISLVADSQLVYPKYT